MSHHSNIFGGQKLLDGWVMWAGALSWFNIHPPLPTILAFFIPMFFTNSFYHFNAEVLINSMTTEGGGELIYITNLAMFWSVIADLGRPAGSSSSSLTLPPENLLYHSNTCTREKVSFPYVSVSI
ncbi:hypothetical protein TNCV_43981 [Trichonephila clavipes]|nr:hypothetical protein TNCV_43981 [Trichonephila clavipes]